MHEAREFDHGHAEPDASLELPFQLRQKCRLRTRLVDGEEIALFLPRGTVLRDGMRLGTTTGRVVLVRAAPETVSAVASTDSHLLTRIAYHLGNRHVPLQIEPGRLAYQHDHVLDDMVEQLGASVRVEQVPFEPEAGAYGGHSHSHTHSQQGDSHSHSHSHTHSQQGDSHSHSHSHSHSQHEVHTHSEAHGPHEPGHRHDPHG